MSVAQVILSLSSGVALALGFITIYNKCSTGKWTLVASKSASDDSPEDVDTDTDAKEKKMADNSEISSDRDSDIKKVDGRTISSAANTDTTAATSVSVGENSSGRTVTSTKDKMLDNYMYGVWLKPIVKTVYGEKSSDNHVKLSYYGYAVENGAVVKKEVASKDKTEGLALVRDVVLLLLKKKENNTLSEAEKAILESSDVSTYVRYHNDFCGAMRVLLAEQ